MNAPVVPHPNDQILHAYGLGKLIDPAVAAVVDSHLESCEACQRRVSELSGDSFVGRLRDSGRRSDASEPAAAPGPPPSGRAKAPAANPALAGTLPPELVENPQYEVLDELGRGGMGVVYLARNTLMDRLEVLKVLNKEMLERKGTYDRFLREVRAAARLNHAHVVGAYSARQIGKLLVFAMEYVEGADLAQLVRTKGPLPVAHACSFAAQAAMGLQHALERGMVHRDIKPGNLMLMRQGQRGIVKILDFGLAKATSENPLDAGLTREGQMLGTPDYIAPEQTLDAQKADIRADIYSLGCTLYYLLTGGPPFRGKSLYDILQAHHSIEARPLNLARPEVPVELAEVVGKMMAKEREQRYQTPAEVAQALTPFFKKGKAALQIPKTVDDPASPVNAGQSRAASIPPETDAGRRNVRLERAAESSPAESRWESMIDFREPEAPKVAASDRRPPRKSWPLVAGGSFFGILGLCVIVITIRGRNGETKVTLPDDRAARIEVDGVTVEHNPTKVRPSAAEGRSASRDGVASPVESRSNQTPGSRPSSFDRTQFRLINQDGGRWFLDEDELVVTRSKNGLYFPTVLFGNLEWEDYDFTVDAMRAEGNFGFAMVFRSTGDQDRFDYLVQGATWEQSAVRALEPGREEDVLGKHLAKLKTNRWYTARVSVRGKHIQCLLSDGENQIKLFDLEDSRHPQGQVGLSTFWSGYHFRNIKVTAPDGTVLWEGPPAVGPKPPIELPPDASLGTTTNSVGMTLKLIPAGAFEMGARDGEPRPDGPDGSLPRHRVRITRSFYLGAYEVTQEQYRQVVGTNPSACRTLPNLPVDSVTWNDAVSFCNKLSLREKRMPYYLITERNVSVLGGDGYRLPTEAEWEYACRAGTTTQYSFADQSGVNLYAWTGAWSGDTTHPVGQKPPNGFRLYDMHGNVAEWCWDWFDDGYYQLGVTDDPTGPKDGVSHVHRGGTFQPRDGRYHQYTSAHRGGRLGVPSNPSPSLYGFRIARNGPA